MNRKGNKQTARTNWPITILLIIGCLTIFFPLYMTIIIAFKQPSEMTNDIAGALAFPSSWSFSNFAQAMEVTRQTIISLENGKYDASLKLAYKIASFFEVSIEEIFLFQED